MPDNLWTVSQQVIILFLVIGLGVVLTLIGLLKDSFAKDLTKFIITIVTPCSIISSFQREFDTTLMQGLLISVGLAFLLNTILIIVSSLCIRTKDAAQRGVLRFAATFGNVGYMGLPLQEAILGSVGVFYGAIYVAVFHMFVWSFGIITISGDKKNFNIRKLISPPLIGITIGLVLFLTSTTLPEVIRKPIAGLGSMNSTLPMIVIGYYLAKTDFKKLFRTGSLYIGIFIRLILCPAIAIGILMLLGVRGDLMISCVIPFSAPSAAITTMLAAEYKKNTDLSVGMVSITTLFAIVTMPLMISIAQSIAY